MTLPPEAGPALTGMARDAITQHLGVAEADPAGADLHWLDHPGALGEWLDAPGASFVTLTQDGALRGCIGSLQATHPLRDDVRDNAVRAATRDPRFSPLTARELRHTAIEVSVLSPPEPLPSLSRADAEAALQPGVDGVILSRRGARATFLPQVWDQLPEPGDFLDHLLTKAGLRRQDWDADLRLERYRVTAFHET